MKTRFLSLLGFALLIAFFAVIFTNPGWLLSTALGLIRFAIAALVLNLVLRMMDGVNGIKFKDWLVEAGSTDRAIYFSSRLVIVGLLAIACLA